MGTGTYEDFLGSSVPWPRHIYTEPDYIRHVDIQVLVLGDHTERDEHSLLWHRVAQKVQHWTMDNREVCGCEEEANVNPESGFSMCFGIVEKIWFKFYIFFFFLSCFTVFIFIYLFCFVVAISNSDFVML